MPTVKDLLNVLQSFVPDTLAESWDNVGLLVGSPEQGVKRVLTALDPCISQVHEAVSRSCDVLLTHHPIIFHPLKSLRTDTPIGSFLAEAIKANLTVIACHTNLDSIAGGVSYTLAQGVGLTEIKPLIPSRNAIDCGLGCMGHYVHPLTANELLDRLDIFCQTPWILEAGPRPHNITRVAVCGGSGSSLAAAAFDLGADAYVTSEIKHDVARWAEEARFWLIDAGHFSTENPVVAVLAKRLQHELMNRELAITVEIAIQEPPLRLCRYKKEQ